MTSFTGHVQFKTVDGLKQVEYHLSSSREMQGEKNIPELSIISMLQEDCKSAGIQTLHLLYRVLAQSICMAHPELLSRLGI